MNRPSLVDIMAETREQKAYLKVMAEKDKEIESPSSRAARVLGYIEFSYPELTQWDMICFCAEYLGMQSAALPAIEPETRKLLSLIYSMHYLTENPEIKVLDEKSATRPSSVSNAPSS